MAKTISEGFDVFLRWITPSDAERAAASVHRAQIEAKLDARFGLYRMFETGSFRHGTGVSRQSDVDYFVSLKSLRPNSSSSILSSVRTALLERFPATRIHVARPAVVLEFGQGYERVEIIPAYFKGTSEGGYSRFDIPGVVTEWLESSPEAHLKYVTDINTQNAIKGGAKGLARLAKAWKYYRNVPVSSFYLEMRAAKYMAAESGVIYSYDLLNFLRLLKSSALADMNDPTGSTGRIRACSSDANRIDALSKLDTAVSRAEWAVYYERRGETAKAFAQWDLLFNGKFPAYY